MAQHFHAMQAADAFLHAHTPIYDTSIYINDYCTMHEKPKNNKNNHYTIT